MLQICNSTSCMFLRYLKLIIIKRLKEYALSIHKSLTDCTVCRLTEISALCMFEVSFSGGKSYLHISERRAGEYADMLFLRKMSQYEPLPVLIKVIFTDRCVKNKAAATFKRFKYKMNFCIMPERFVVSDSLHRCSDSFLIRNSSRSE